METYVVRIIDVVWVTHNVRRFIIEKPEGYSFIPGQATEVSINKPGFYEEKRPFTFTCLSEDNFLEFTIKIYSDHQGVTNELGKLNAGDELIIRDVWGTINYKGRGVFIAGGAGITPFIAIFRRLFKDNLIEGNKLIFSNRTSKDIILKDEFEKMLGENYINIITEESGNEHFENRINKKLLNKIINDFSQNFYICGPKPMVRDLKSMLTELGADPQEVIFEK